MKTCRLSNKGGGCEIQSVITKVGLYYDKAVSSCLKKKDKCLCDTIIFVAIAGRHTFEFCFISYWVSCQGEQRGSRSLMSMSVSHHDIWDFFFFCLLFFTMGNLSHQKVLASCRGLQTFSFLKTCSNLHICPSQYIFFIWFRQDLNKMKWKMY